MIRSTEISTKLFQTPSPTIGVCKAESSTFNDIKSAAGGVFPGGGGVEKMDS